MNEWMNEWQHFSVSREDVVLCGFVSVVVTYYNCLRVSRACRFSTYFEVWCPRDWDVNRQQPYKSGLPSSRHLGPCCMSAVCWTCCTVNVKARVYIGLDCYKWYVYFVIYCVHCVLFNTRPIFVLFVLSIYFKNSFSGLRSSLACCMHLGPPVTTYSVCSVCCYVSILLTTYSNNTLAAESARRRGRHRRKLIETVA